MELGHQLAVDDALHGESDHQGGGVVARHLHAPNVHFVRYQADEVHGSDSAEASAYLHAGEGSGMRLQSLALLLLHRVQLHVTLHQLRSLQSSKKHATSANHHSTCAQTMLTAGWSYLRSAWSNTDQDQPLLARVASVVDNLIAV